MQAYLQQLQNLPASRPLLPTSSRSHNFPNSLTQTLFQCFCFRMRSGRDTWMGLRLLSDAVSKAEAGPGSWFSYDCWASCCSCVALPLSLQQGQKAAKVRSSQIFSPAHAIALFHCKNRTVLHTA